MKKVLITMSALAIALATASASYACGASGCSLAPRYSSFSNGNCCGCAAPIYSYYVPLAPKCCCKVQSCNCGCAAPCDCKCGCAAPCDCCCQNKGYRFW